MTDRTDPMFYEFEIRERKTGQLERVPVHCWWSGSGSEEGLRAMCDCQLGAYFDTSKKLRERNHSRPLTDWGNWFSNAQFEYLQQHQCNHKPSKRFEVLQAFVGGDVIAIAA